MPEEICSYNDNTNNEDKGDYPYDKHLNAYQCDQMVKLKFRQKNWKSSQKYHQIFVPKIST